MFDEGDAPVLLRPFSANHDDVVADAAVELVRASDLRAVSIASIARHIRVTPPALSQRYGNRTRLDQMVVAKVLDRWWSWEQRAVWLEARAALAALLPREDEISDVRVALSFLDLARTAAPKAYTEIRETGRSVTASCLRRILDREPLATELDVVGAVVDGLRVAVTDPVNPLTPEQARAALHLVIGALTETSPVRAAEPGAEKPAEPLSQVVS